MLDFLATVKREHTDDDSIHAISEIENCIREKKYGLIWEEYTEAVDKMLEENIPVLCEDPERRLCKDASLPFNFIIEGDNLQALYLLKKTHRGKIDCIYIDIILQSLIQSRGKSKRASLRYNFCLRCRMCAGLIGVDLFTIL